MHVLQIAAENDALPGGKVGGLGDVLRDLPIGLAKAGQRVTVITPGYGIFASRKGSRNIASVPVSFAGKLETLQLFEVASRFPSPGVTQLVVEHPLFSAYGPGRIYVDDNAGPFATDAHKFALFCAAVVEALHAGLIEQPDILHCHDWHAALVLLLRQFDPRYSKLAGINSVFSIHNLSLQGVRPLKGVDSALESWFPGLEYTPERIVDPYHADCVNLMRAGINLADHVHTVSPTYAREILHASDWAEGMVGGEGLENDLQRVAGDGRLYGILNGCDYDSPAVAPDRAAVWRLVEQSLDQWVKSNPANGASYYLALKRLNQIRRLRGGLRPVLVSIGRLTPQKLYLLVQNYRENSVMNHVLTVLKPGVFIMLGSGDQEYNRFFTDMMSSHGNFLYLNGYAESLSAALYGFGDLFVMPSIYEPCGISQMLAMRNGVPCLVHQVGGLQDTVSHGKNGFSFSGRTLAEKQHNLLVTLQDTLRLFHDDPRRWGRIADAARQARFSWEVSIGRYLGELYRFD